MMRKIITFCLTGFVLALALPMAAQAQTGGCVARVDHRDIIIAPGAVEGGTSSWRERLMGWPSGLWNQAWGNPVPCDSGTTIAFLAGISAMEDVDSMCLAEAPDNGGWLLVPGQRNYRGHCQGKICTTVNTAVGGGTAIARDVTRLATGREVDSLGDGVSAIASTSGAMMLTGQSSTILGLLGQGAGAVTTALSAPLLAGAAAVTVVAVGGVVYACN